MASKYPSNSETTNFARLSRLVVDICCDVLRTVVQAQLPPPGLVAMLQSQKFHICKNLEHRQRLILYPSGGVFSSSLKELDFTLLYKLVRNIQGINIPPHQNGWGKTPDDADRTLSANIDRLRFQRNEAYGHLPTASLSDTDFNDRWDIIRQSVYEIEKGTLTGDTYVVAVDALRSMSMDPDTENVNIKELEKQYQADTEVKAIVLQMKAGQEVMTTSISDVTSRLEAIGIEKEIHPKISALIETTHAMLKEEQKTPFVVTKAFNDALEKLRKNRFDLSRETQEMGKQPPPFNSLTG